MSLEGGATSSMDEFPSFTFISHQTIVYQHEIFELFQERKVDYENGDKILHLTFRNKSHIEKDVTKLLETFLDQRINSNIQNDKELTVLHLAVANRWRDVVDLSLKNKTNIDTKNLKGNTIAHFFVKDEFEKFGKCFQIKDNRLIISDDKMKQMEIESANFVEWLISRGFNFDHKNKDGISALDLCMMHGLQHILVIILKHMQSVDEAAETLIRAFINKKDRVRYSYSDNVLTKNRYSAYSSRYAAEIVKLLLVKGASVGRQYKSCLQTAICREDDLSIMKILTDHRLKSCCDSNSATAMFAELFDYIFKWDESKTKYFLTVLPTLIAKGANVNIKDKDGKTPLYFSFETANQSAIDFLDKSCADFGVITKGEGDNLLHALAQSYSDDDTIEALFDLIQSKRCCDVNAKNSSDETPLHLAAQNGNTAMVQKLIENGAEINCRDCSKMTPLHVAAEHNDSEDIVELLLQNGADVNAKDQWSCRPLHLAADKNCEMVRALLKEGAYVNCYANRESPLFTAINNYCVENVEEMLMYGADINDQAIISLLGELRPESRFMKLLMRTIKCHWIKLKAAKLPSSEKYKALTKSKKYKKFYEKCLEEIRLLKNTYINSHISLYEFLHMGVIDRLFHNNNNKELKRLVDCSTVKRQFPIYSAVILASYHEAVTWKKLLEPAKQAWHQLIKVSLPEECIELILVHLRVEDLASMVEHDQDL